MTNTDKLIKQQLLEAITNTDTLEEALSVMNITKGQFYSYLTKDKTFLKRFDKIINLKLEIALLESALKSKSASILSFSLANRLPLKYNKSAKENKEEAPAQIIYVQES